MDSKISSDLEHHGMEVKRVNLAYAYGNPATMEILTDKYAIFARPGEGANLRYVRDYQAKAKKQDTKNIS